jgi:hypothetical protein
MKNFTENKIVKEDKNWCPLIILFDIKKPDCMKLEKKENKEK